MFAAKYVAQKNCSCGITTHNNTPGLCFAYFFFEAILFLKQHYKSQQDFNFLSFQFILTEFKGEICCQSSSLCVILSVYAADNGK